VKDSNKLRGLGGPTRTAAVRWFLRPRRDSSGRGCGIYLRQSLRLERQQVTNLIAILDYGLTARPVVLAKNVRARMVILSAVK
jgi:hypothetical protein